MFDELERGLAALACVDLETLSIDQVAAGIKTLSSFDTRLLAERARWVRSFDREHGFIISGTGELIEPDDGILAVGSGGTYALAAARALVRHTKFSAKQVATEALKIASEICIYTNGEIMVEEL